MADRLNLLLRWLLLGCLLPAWSGVGSAYDGPFIDSHNHWNGSRSAEKFVAAKDEFGVAGTVIMARYYGNPQNKQDLPGTDDQALEASRKYPKRFFPLVGMQLPQLTAADWNRPNDWMLGLYERTRKKLASGDFFGIGEIILRHYPYFNHPAPPGQHSDIRKDPDSRHMDNLADLARDFDLPVVVHMEGEPALVERLKRFLSRHAGLKSVWSHMCGRVSPQVLSELLGQFPHLYCDLSAMVNVGPTSYGYSVGKNHPARDGWPEAYEWTHLMEANGRFFPEVEKLILARSTRFLGVGMDNAHMEFPYGAYKARFLRFKSLLATLPAAVARDLAFENPVRVFRLPLQGK